MSTGEQELERWPPASDCMPRSSRVRDRHDFALLQLRRLISNPPTPEMRAAIEQWADKWAGITLGPDERQDVAEQLAIVRRFC
jgi:hypothetical protein